MTEPEVRAAGGVVLRLGPGRRLEALLVHRPGHRDWTLPKGKAGAGEPDEACALREVAEETGLVCRLGPEVGATRYRDRRGCDKRVRYWAMTVARGAFAPNAEVDQARWLPLEEAVARLSYEGDRAILGRLEPVFRGLVFLVRHAHAVDPSAGPAGERTWSGDPGGRQEVASLATSIAGYPVTRILACPCDWCLQVLEPLSALLARPVEQARVLAGDTDPPRARELLAGLGPGPLVLCAHGGAIRALVGPGAQAQEGTVWLLAREGPALRPLRAWPPVD